MKKIYKLISFMCLALWAQALSAQAHWDFDYRQYQYDMTVYFQLTLKDGQVITDTDGYEIAAFVGEQCCGIGELQTILVDEQTVTYGYMRIYSNSTSGGTVTFKAYDKSKDEEVDLNSSETVTFNNLSVAGMPSAPISLAIVPTFTPGDADGDGIIGINDVIMTIDASLGNPAASFIKDAADLDGDGNITINDVIMLIDLTLNK